MSTEDERKRIASILRGKGHNCESLGVCMHPDRKCTGACEQKPVLPALDEGAQPLMDADRTLYRLVCAAAVFVTLCWIAGYVYARWFA